MKLDFVLEKPIRRQQQILPSLPLLPLIEVITRLPALDLLLRYPLFFFGFYCRRDCYLRLCYSSFCRLDQITDDREICRFF